ncbi:MAG: DUF2115 domain-containing protein [Methanocalculus sp. MSAO_Arc2]|uniref:DUF2115 domain-containing protein n=1 Tax=Methanocalculus sp. MSAO_Arc2 TaxID=2293855 RepID=UPI000FF23D08|nr:MAG: DUF2115 domain-containing protein [Methanocalculus sp. MSAO_Arc2]
MNRRLFITGPHAREEIHRITSQLRESRTRSDLANLIAQEVRRYSPHDLLEIAAALRSEIQDLPASYRSRYAESVHEQIFGTYHRILLMERKDQIKRLKGSIPDTELFGTFCRMIEEACLTHNVNSATVSTENKPSDPHNEQDVTSDATPDNQGTPQENIMYTSRNRTSSSSSPHRTEIAHMTPMGRLLYYLLSCFVIFVLGEPGHPIGTPFPGGFKVELKRGVICCPVREKEDEVPYALCRFCPAEQG